MKLHGSLIEKLVRIYSTYGGYREDTKLKDELSKLDVSTYTRASGEVVLVDTNELKVEINKLK